MLFLTKKVKAINIYNNLSHLINYKTNKIMKIIKKLFKINVSYGQFIVVASSKEEAYKLFHPDNEKEAYFYAYYDVEMEDIHEIEGYKVEGETAVVGDYAE